MQTKNARSTTPEPQADSRAAQPQPRRPLRSLSTLAEAVALLDEWVIVARRYRAERDAARDERDRALMQLIIERDHADALEINARIPF